MKQPLNPATHFAMLLMALAMAFTFLACEEKGKKAEAGTFTDARDGKVYKTVKIGEQVWMAENLNFKTENSRCYGDDEANCKKYGRLYGYGEFSKVCPKGWHLPSDEEWSILVQTVGGKDVAGKKLKSKTGWGDFDGKSGNGTDEFGFSALPGGFFNEGNIDNFTNIGVECRWWEDQSIGRLDDMGEIGGADPENYGKSIRCIQGDGGTASKAASPATDTDYSPALQTHYSKGTLGESGKTRPIEMFFQKVSKNGDSYSISGKSKTKAAEDAFSGTLSISSQTASGSCNSGETELKGSYDLNEKESKTSGHFVGTFTACETSGKLSKANFKGDWVKHANGNKTPCEFELSHGSRLLESMTIESTNYNTTYKFEYDDKDRIIKLGIGDEKPIETSKFIYSTDGSVKIAGTLYYHGEDHYERKFVRKGNTITAVNCSELDTIKVNKDGYTDKSERTRANEGEGDGDPWAMTYQYLGNNLIKLTSTTGTTEFKYDNKKSPFYHGNTPKWLLQYLFMLHWEYGLNNNIVEIDYGGGYKRTYEYEYDSEGFPTKQTMGSTITFFTYRSTTKGANQ